MIPTMKMTTPSPLVIQLDPRAVALTTKSRVTKEENEFVKLTVLPVVGVDGLAMRMSVRVRNPR